MKKVIIGLLVLFSFQAEAQIFRSLLSKRSASVDTTKNLLIVFLGESNSGGYAPNSSATAAELDETQFIQIWDNINNDGFENLDIGTNNLLGHAGFESFTSIHHGWELQLSNRAESDSLGYPIYLAKTGQGGSRVGQWIGETLSYGTVSPWDTAQVRITGSLNEIQRLNGGTTYIYVMMSLGINDSTDNNNPDVFKTKFEQILTNFRNKYGADVPFFATELMENTANKIAYNVRLRQIANSDPFFTLIETGDLDDQLRDVSHWNYTAMKTIADRMFDMIKTDFDSK